MIRIEKCFLLEIGNQEPTLGFDPELDSDTQIIKDVAWFPLDSVQDDIQMSKVIESLDKTDDIG